MSSDDEDSKFPDEEDVLPPSCSSRWGGRLSDNVTLLELVRSTCRISSAMTTNSAIEARNERGEEFGMQASQVSRENSRQSRVQGKQARKRSLRRKHGLAQEEKDTRINIRRQNGGKAEKDCEKEATKLYNMQ
mmetsp:Transcript_93511/g.204790  ORF Transcript_93511/g.204790 Transcript_93511/m.204790 type:complete len:133 (-) Transcript_93511:42-440(-)